MRYVKLLLSVIVLGSIIYFFEFGGFGLPPLGKLVNPASGFWTNAVHSENEYPSAVSFPQLKDKVEVVYDDRLVAHIFAQNDYDLYFTQGYITAKHRLWQMEFQTHYAAGRISEIVGERAINLDRLTRRKGLLYAAEQSLKAFQDDEQSITVLNAYSDGVNQFISELTPANLPIEYKLLNYQPEAWTPLKSTLLLKYMADMLTGKSYDIEFTNALNLVGSAMVNLMYPDFPDTLANPIVFSNTIFDAPFSTPTAPGTISVETAYTAQLEKGEKGIGSNNWAVNGKKTASGKPILCNDPHLMLNLPSIWYEIQLHTPQTNTYGVSIPGAPAIIIGFNQHIAWGVTNASIDVQDWYKVTFKDETKRSYLFDGKWLESDLHIEHFAIKGKDTITDTVFYTHYGPVVYSDSLTKDTAALNLAIRWTAHDASNELSTFYKLNRAKNYQEYLKAISTYECPGQNFVFAAADGDIAIWQQGKFPLKWKEQGKYVMDGSKSVYQWDGFIPQQDNPHLYNPSQNFVQSANQNPTNASYPYYYNGTFEYFRNNRIVERLSSMDKITPEDMMLLQNDNKNLQAEWSLPIMLKYLNVEQAKVKHAHFVEELQKWNYFNDYNSVGAILYEEWFTALENLIWDELKVANQMLDMPSEYTTIRIMQKYPNHTIFDKKDTEAKETLGDLIQESFETGMQKVNEWNNANSSDLMWSNWKATSVKHLALLEPFSVHNLMIGGNKRIVNACGERWGPSWRMIVSFESPMKAYGVYPGGQSGNPGSQYYLTGISKWAKGEYFELLFLENKSQLTADKKTYEQTFSPSK